jgi:hypothetical protein
VAGQFPGIELFDASVENNRIILTPVQVTPVALSLESIRKKIQLLGLTEEDVNGAVAWARK